MDTTRLKYYKIWLLAILLNIQPVVASEIDSLSFEELGNIGLSNIPTSVTVTTTSKTSQKTTSTPSAVRIISAEQIKYQGYQTIGEILESMPGLYTSSNNVGTFLGVRGVGRPGDYNTRVLILIDGIRVNDNIFDSALVGREFPLDVGLISRVEYSPGPGSAVYGKNAFFGVINVITKNGGWYDGFEVSAGTGSSNTEKIRLSAGTRFNGGAEVLLSATSFKNEDVSESFFPEYSNYDSDSDENISLFSKFSYKSLRTEIIYGKRQTEVQYLLLDAGNDYEEFEDDRLLVNTQYNTKIGSDWHIELKGTYGDATYEETLPYIWAGDGLKYEDAIKYTGSWLTGEIKIINTSFQNHRLLFGLEGHSDLSMEVEAVSKGNDYYEKWYDEDDTYQSFGFYFQDEINLTQDLTFIIGARYDDTEFEDDLNPRVGLIWQASDTTVTKLLYGSAFRTPNYYEIELLKDYNRHAELFGLSHVPQLQNEKITTYEAIVEHSLNDFLFVSGSLYYFQLDDLIEIDDYLPINIDTIDAIGLELDIQQRFENGSLVNLSYTVQRTEGEDGQRLTNSPAHQVKLKFLVPLGLAEATIGSELQYISERKNQDGETLDDYLIANLSVTFDITNDISISANVYNLSDTSYESPINDFEERGRSFYCNVDVRF